MRSACERLARAGLVPHIQGTAVHDRPDAVVAVYAAICSALAAATVLWPLPALAALLLVAISARVDLDGGTGAVRSLLPRQIGYNVVGWPPGRIARADGGPTLLVAAPLVGDRHVRRRSPWLLAPVLGLVLVLSGVAVQIALDGASVWPQSVGAALFFGTAVIAGTRAARATVIGPVGPPAELVLDLAARLAERETEHLAVVVALVGGGDTVGDGLSTLLLNQRHAFPPSQCRVLVVASTQGSRRMVRREGHLLRRDADPLLAAAAGAAGLAQGDGCTGAARVSALGWRALAIAGVQSGATVEQIVRGLDEAAQGGKW